MRKNAKKRLPGLLLAVALAVLEALFLGMLASTKLVPAKLLLIGGAALLAVTLLLWLLLRDWSKKGRWICGAVLALVLVVALGAASFFVDRTVDMLNSITDTSVEVADVAVYVRAEDPAQGLEDIESYAFGILEAQDRENTDGMLSKLEKTFGGAPEVVAYENLSLLVEEVLLGEKIQAIVLNTAYYDVLSETEGMEVLAAALRQLHVEQVETLVEQEPEETEPATTVPEGQLPTFCMYLSGVDTYGDIMAKGRSDVNILAVVNPNTRQVLLLSTPRDYYVELPLYGGVMDKLTHAGIYGIDVSMQTLEELYDEKINYYFRVNFSGFQDIIDALDGITVNSEFSFYSIGGYYYDEGENHLYGEEALSFARERNAFGSGDIQRGKNQMAVIEAVIDKALSPALLTNFTGVMESLEGSFETDMPYELIAELVRAQLEDMGSWNIVTYSVTGEGNTLDCYSSGEAYVMMQDEDMVAHAAELIDKVKKGGILTQE